MIIAQYMLFHSDRTYFPDQSKLDLIFKELQDLKLIIGRLENKNKEDNSRDHTRDRRVENTDRRSDREDI